MIFLIIESSWLKDILSSFVVRNTFLHVLFFNTNSRVYENWVTPIWSNWRKLSEKTTNYSLSLNIWRKTFTNSWKIGKLVWHYYKVNSLVFKVPCKKPLSSVISFWFYSIHQHCPVKNKSIELFNLQSFFLVTNNDHDIDNRWALFVCKY